MNVYDKMEQLRKKAEAEEGLRTELIATKRAGDPLFEFCKISCREGIELSPMDVIVYGEEMYAEIKRSTNGGGENSPALEGQDDPYELFIAELEK